VWTGERLVLWGGGGTRDGPQHDVGCEPVCNPAVAVASDVVAYDPASDAWERLPDLPEQLRGPTWPVVWADGRALVGVARGHEPWRLHAYDPVTGEARPLAELVGRPQLEAWTWTGGELLALRTKSSSPGDGTPVAVLRYDPAADAWSELPPPPVEATRDLGMVWTGEALVLWGGSRWPDDFSGGIAPVRATGARFDPTAAADAPEAPSPDFAVDVAVEVDGALPAALAVDGEVHGVAIGEAVDVVVAVEADADVLVRRPDDAAPLRELGHDGPGRLLLVGWGDAYERATVNPERGLITWASDLLPGGLWRSGRRLLHPLAVVTDEPPFAPVEGTYVAEVPVEWWRAVAPPAPYPEEPDGTATVRYTVTLTAVSEEGAADRSDQPAAREALGEGGSPPTAPPPPPHARRWPGRPARSTSTR
jgi:hypothetical protein